MLRLLSAMGSQGVARAWMLPDAAGIGARVRESAELARLRRGLPMPQVELLDMAPTDSARDSIEAAALMRRHGARLLAVLGGDGTHRAVAAACGDLPLATLSTGTNNAFPGTEEATQVGLAGALVAAGRVPAALALRANKRLRLRGPGVDESALVDLCVSRQSSIGGRAVWRSADLCSLYACFAEPGATGLSAIAAFAHPVGRAEPWGIEVEFGPGRALDAPVMPGWIERVSIAALRRIRPGAALALAGIRGTLAIDGEREIEIEPDHAFSIELDWGGPRTLDVPAVLDWAARQGQLFSDRMPMPLRD
ncbi:MAG: NAD(+)/NADH kinase [Burkholderiales bacterium]|nr:NAD(+)/NADH kinase [Burkholderiales bacterium]MDE2454288.1 NAD(+)/NADH kinase [Burkholderiales bacterium]